MKSLKRLIVTKVVFEFATFLLKPAHVLRLTVTKVVFEFDEKGRFLQCEFKINSNKSCFK